MLCVIDRLCFDFWWIYNQPNVIAGWGTNEGLIISILAHRNAAQRKLIRETYAETYGEDLLKVLDKELTSDFEVSARRMQFVQ